MGNINMVQALYRQYRSKRFSEVIGQEHITDLLAAAVDQNTISHAYLFTGPRGIGKTSVARILAHAINDIPYSDTTHLDIIEIDAASNRRIDDIRDLREKVHITPSTAKYKVYIVDEVHMLTNESFNALLKTLEEPPAHVVFILATTELHKVPATIVSRTQRFSFRPVGTEIVVNHLRTIATDEKISIDDDALTLIAQHGEGSFRDSISLLDQLSTLKDKRITRTTVEELLGLAPKDQIIALISAVVASDTKKAVEILQNLQDNGTSSQTITAQLLVSLPGYASDHPELYNLIHQLLDVPRSYAPHFKLMAVIATASQKNTTHRPMAARTAPQLIVASAEVAVKLPKKSSATIKETTQPTIDPDYIPDNEAPVAFDWDMVLGELQKRSTALHSVLKRARVTHTQKALTLEFAYSLHKKKLEDGKYRTQLAHLITSLCGSCPEIIVTLKSPSVPAPHKTAASVAVIMGGGEQVNV